MNKIVAVVVTYNRKELLKQCLESIEAQQGATCDIIIVDNASTDGTKEYIAESIEKENIQYYNTGSNIGGAGGFNYGMRLAVNLGYEYVWIMDDDTMPQADCLQELMGADEILEGDYGFLSSAVLWKDGSYCKMNRQKICKNAYEKVELVKHGLVPVYHATFVSLFFRASTIIQEGLPIKEFFIWGDDVEYTHRLSKSKACYLVGKSQVIHAMNSNVGSSIAEDGIERIGRYRFAYRNENYIARQEGMYGRGYYFLKCCLNMGRILVKAKDHRAKRCWIILSRMVSGLFFNPKVEYVELAEER